MISHFSVVKDVKLLAQEAVLSWGDDPVVADEATIETPSGGRLVLDNDPISFAVLFCVTAVALSYIAFKIKKLNNDNRKKENDGQTNF